MHVARGVEYHCKAFFFSLLLTPFLPILQTSKCLVDAHPELRRPMLRYVVKGGPSHGFSLLDGLLSRHSRPYFGEPQSSCTEYFDKHAYELRKVFLFRSLTTYSSQPPKIHCIHVFCRTQPIYNPAPTQATTDKSPCTMEARQVSVRCAIRQSHFGQGHREWQTPLTITFGSCRLETSRAPSSYKNYHAHSWTIPSFFLRHQHSQMRNSSPLHGPFTMERCERVTHHSERWKKSASKFTSIENARRSEPPPPGIHSAQCSRLQLLVVISTFHHIIWL